MSFKSKIFLILSHIFTILTLFGACLVITHKLDNAGYVIVPMVFAIAFIVSYKNSKKDQ